MKLIMCVVAEIWPATVIDWVNLRQLARTRVEPYARTPYHFYDCHLWYPQ